MKSKLKRALSSWVCLLGITLVICILIPLKGSHSQPPTPATGGAAIGGELMLDSRLSQTMLVHGTPGQLTIDLGIQAPHLAEARIDDRAAEVVVVLDRSGSMAAENKLPYAKQAIIALIERLGSRDRFALIEFDTHARVVYPLTQMTASNQRAIINSVQALRPGASTNMSDGLQRAFEQFTGEGEGSSRRTILISDGHANVGTTDVGGLSRIARDFSARGIILSTIGLGLDFNEIVLASIADNGMGQYAFLEHPNGLDSIFARELDTARSIFANNTEVELHLSPRVQVRDASGYPIEYLNADKSKVRILTGQLASGSNRRLMITLDAPTDALGTHSLGTMHLAYQIPEGTRTRTSGKAFEIEVVPASRKDEALATYDADVFRKSWVENNLGKLQQAFGNSIREGRRQEAAALLEEYEQKASSAPAPSQAVQDGVLSSIKAETSKLKQMLEDALPEDGSGSAQERNRAAKSLYSLGLDNQRSQASK